MAGMKKNSQTHIEAAPLVIPDEFEGYPLNYLKSNLACSSDSIERIFLLFFSLPLHYREDLKSVLIPYGLVQDRIEALARRIFDDLHIDIPEQLSTKMIYLSKFETRISSI